MNHLLEFALAAVVVILLLQNFLAAPGLLRFLSSGFLALIGIALIVGAFMVQVNQIPESGQGSMAGRMGQALKVLVGESSSSAKISSSSSQVP